MPNTSIERRLPAAAKPASARRLRMAMLLGSLSAFGPLSLDMYLPALPALAKELETSASLAQFSLTACLLGLSMGQLLAGPVSDVRGRRRPLLIGVLIYAAASLLCAASPSIGTFLLLRFVQGLAGAAGIVIARAMARDMYAGSELTKFFALLMLFNGAAPILAPIAGGQLLQFMTWRGVFVVLSLIGLALFMAALWAAPETLAAEKRSSGGLRSTLRTFRGLIGDRLFMGYALTQGLVSGAMFAYIAGSPFVIQEVFGASPQLFSVMFAVNGLGLIIASQTTGRLAGKIKEARLFVFGIGAAAFGGLGLLTAIVSGAGLAWILPFLFVAVSSVGIVNTTGFALAMQRYGQSAGAASALLGLLSYILGGLVAPLVGIAGSHTAVPMGLVMAGAHLGAIGCYVFLVAASLRNQARIARDSA